MGESIEARLFHQIHGCSNLMQRGCHALSEKNTHMRRGQGRLLGLLMHHDGMSMKEIVRKMDIRPSSGGELVDKLIQQGYVQRRNDGADKRVCNVYLTDKGRMVALDMEGQMQQLFPLLFEDLNDGEKQQLSELLGKLKQSLKDKYGYRRDEQAKHVAPGNERCEASV